MDFFLHSLLFYRFTIYKKKKQICRKLNTAINLCRFLWFYYLFYYCCYTSLSGIVVNKFYLYRFSFLFSRSKKKKKKKKFSLSLIYLRLVFIELPFFRGWGLREISFSIFLRQVVCSYASPLRATVNCST